MIDARPAYDDVGDALWEITKTDWRVRVSLSLTEPFCALVTLVPDDPKYPTLENFIGTGDANESIRRACEHAIETIRKMSN